MWNPGWIIFIFVDFKSLKHFHRPLKYLGPMPIVPVDMGPWWWRQEYVEGSPDYFGAAGCKVCSHFFLSLSPSLASSLSPPKTRLYWDWAGLNNASPKSISTSNVIIEK